MTSSLNGNGYAQLSFLNEDDPIGLLGSNNYLDQLVPIIKSSLKDNTVNTLIEKLKNEGLKKDNELSNELNANEEKITSSAKDISLVSRGASSINEQLLDINDHLARTSNLTIQKKFKLLELKKNINKIGESEIIINKILQVLELADRTHELIKQNKFFNALKNLNDLSNLNKEFDKDFKFLQSINESIPVLKSVVEDESLGLLRRNLGSLDVKFEEISNVYQRAFTKLLKQWDQFKTRDLEKYKINSPVELSLRSTYSEGIPEPEMVIDISFIYDTLLVFKELDQIPFLKEELNKEIRGRREKALYPFVVSDTKNENFKKYIKDEENLSKFLSKISGYLIFHRFFSVKFPQLVTQEVDDQWDTLSTKIYPFLKNLVLNEILIVERIVRLNDIFGKFYLILETLNLNTEYIYNLLILTFKKFSQLATFQFSKEFTKLSEEDDSMPMVIYDIKLYRKITNVSWYEDSRDEKDIKFPQVLPFSTIYPMTCAQIRNFINQQHAFLKDFFKFDIQFLNKLIIENVDNLFSTTINKHYISKLDLVTREEISQNLINLEYFLIMTKEISSQLSEEFGKQITLKSIDAIANTRKTTESRLFELVDGKIDDLMDFIDWDWSIRDINHEPNYFIKDIGDFLKNMFNSTFSNLPYSVKTLLLYRVFDLLAIRFLENLDEQNVITIASIHNFDQDISYIERITKELSPNKNEKDNRESLQSMFLQLRQSINLLKSGSLDEYKDQSLRNREYDQIKPEYAVQLINKIERKLETPTQVSPQPTSSTSKIFSKFRGNNNT